MAFGSEVGNTVSYRMELEWGDDSFCGSTVCRSNVRTAFNILMKPLGFLHRYLCCLGCVCCLNKHMNISGINIDFRRKEKNNMILKKKRFRERSRQPVQNFDELKQQCLANDILFEDPEFPANNSSLKNMKYIDSLSIEWKRPGEIMNKPQFLIEGFSRYSFQQGRLDNCWLVAAINNLTMNELSFSQVVPKDQSFNEDYAGIFHFRFWYYGQWVDIVIDDRLPTNDGTLICLNPIKSNEFWAALLEKAYAKLYGSYGALNRGRPKEAMQHFTGGIAEIYEDLIGESSSKFIQHNLFDNLLSAFERDSMLCCDIIDTVIENQREVGLRIHHTYTITHIKYVDTAMPDSEEKIPFLRLRNPEGREFTWDPPSDDSYKWRFVPDYEKIRNDLPLKTDGEFWMSFDNFKRYFTDITIWNKNLMSLVGDDWRSDEKTWKINKFEGDWVRGVTAGGYLRCLEKLFCHNPQYVVTLENPSEESETCTLIVALMQKNRREFGESKLSIGFFIFHLDDLDILPKPLDFNFFKSNEMFDSISFYSCEREVTQRFELPPGTYCIVPTTYSPNEEGEFLLRIASEKNNAREYDESVEIGEIDVRISEESERDLDDNELLKSFQESGELDSEKLETLGNDLRNWTAAFRLYDNGAGVLQVFKLREALNSAGYKLNNNILNILGIKYCTVKGGMTFDNFIMCAVHLKTMFDYFHDYRELHPENTDSEIFMMMKSWIEDICYE